MAELGGAVDNGGASASMVTIAVPDVEAEADSLSREAGVSPPAASTNYDSSDGQIPIHRCEICHNYEAFSKQALLTHTASCSAQNNDQNSRKLFECDICQMKFSNGANMRRHKMRHTGVKPYECRICQKRFFRKDHLAEHFTTHTKTLPYHCPICNRGFQRQIAMRAHFQNEHVGQHDMIKSCPLCSYRAGTMKALRVHFFNRHGIDLDNPGPIIPSTGVIPSNEGGSQGGTYSDSGDSLGARSIDNATPPMHFLTPHVEISMADTPIQCDEPTVPANPGSGNELLNGDSPNGSPRSGDSNAPSSSQQPSASSGSGSNGGNGAVSENEAPQPCIKQEPETENNNTSLIKISPLKSLLRDDLKRKLSITSHPRRNANSLSSGANGNGSNSSTGSGHGVTVASASAAPSSLLSGAATEDWSSLRCVYCGISFPDQTLYFLHKGCHSDSNPWKCNICGEQCSNVYEFNSHLLSKTHQ